MASLYHRKLLNDVESSEISAKIEDAVAYVTEETEWTNHLIRDALLNRLKFRKLLLSAVQLDGFLDDQRARLWEGCLELLPMLSQTYNLGVPSEDSFGIKIQRKLASSVPPRSIIKIDFDEAFAQLSGICQNARDAYRILVTQAATPLMVCISCVRFLTEIVLTLR